MTTASWVPALRFDPAAGRATLNEYPIDFTRQELIAFELLYGKRGQLVRTEEFVAHVRRGNTLAQIGKDPIERLIQRIRRKLGEDGEHQRYLLTVKGLGFRLVPHDLQA